MPSTCWIVNTRRGESVLALSDWACVQGSKEHRAKSIWSAHSECSASGQILFYVSASVLFTYIYVLLFVNIIFIIAAAAAASPQSCPTLCDPIDGLPPGSPVPGILQARTLDWVAVSFSNA